MRNRAVFSVVFSQKKSAAERVGMWEFAAGSRLVSLKTRVRRISKRRWELWESGFSISMISTVAAFPHAIFGYRTSEFLSFPGRNWPWLRIKAILPAENAF